MSKLISIDPGKCKCGLILADLYQKRVDQAVVLNTKFLPQYVETLNSTENISKVIIGNGTTSRQNIEKLKFLKKELLVVEEKNTTLRAKKRYFEIFPLEGLKSFLPREIFILNKNLDALAALVILEDYYDCKFEMDKKISIKTWLK